MTRTARENLSSRCFVDYSHIFASGAFKNVYLGTYASGNRNGSKCVSKVFKEGSVFEVSYFDNEIQVVNKTIEIVDRFNADNIIPQMIWVNQPGVWQNEVTGEKSLIEPFIANFEKFNSNTGWTPDHTNKWIEIMQALSHYSYHISNAQILLCDLQGGVRTSRDPTKRGFIVTDPVIMSNSRDYGPSDLGAEGISTFFARHSCTQYCGIQWSRPRDTRTYFKMQRGSSMELHNKLNLKLTSQFLPKFPQRQNISTTIEEDYSDSDY
jgi:hypothetical protein